MKNTTPEVGSTQQRDASSTGRLRLANAELGAIPHPDHASTTSSGLLDALRGYVEIARPDHWFKNVFMLLGVVLALFCRPDLLNWFAAPQILLALCSVCLVASSNYVLNEILDARSDRQHPVKRHRAIPSGRVAIPMAYLEWLVLGIIGIGMAALVNRPFLLSAAGLWIMGLVYNVPPVRSKDLPYVDVLTESINNPLRLMLGWFAVTTTVIPPMSLMVAYWMIGAFFMAAKRFSEYRMIGDPATAAAYRKSFAHYDETKLLVSMFFYVTCFAMFLGIFIIRYHLELILSFPLIGGFVCYYLLIAFRQDSATQSPEKLYRERGLMVYLMICVTMFVLLMFVEIRPLYQLFNVPPTPIPTLWHL